MSAAFGLGLRPPFYADATAGKVPVDWFELISENFMVDGGPALRILDAVRERYPIALHGVSMNLGGTDALDETYLRDLERLVRRARPLLVSDHLCWTRRGGEHLHDLLPLPYTEEAVEHVAGRIRQVQDRLGRQILVENVSTYLQFAGTLSESEFVSAVAERADCLLLLDVNNLFVNAHNHGFDPLAYLRVLPAHRVRQLHLAGHSTSGMLRIDTHDRPVADQVWGLYAEAAQLFRSAIVMIERDEAIPPLPDLLSELDRARDVRAEALAA